MLGSDTPRFREFRKKPRLVPDAWLYMGVIIASPKVAEIMSKYEPLIQTVALDWVFSDGGRLDGYVFLDIHRAIAAYDYKRSDVLIEHDDTRKFVAGLGTRRALRSDIDPSIHAFREAFLLHEIFVSREMAMDLLQAGLSMDFLDPATMASIEMGGVHRSTRNKRRARRS
jgi:hypothetical protein